MIRFHRNDLPAEASFGEGAAIDTETLGLAVGRDRLCVVQVSRGDGTADIVQIAAGQTSAPNLQRLLADPAIVKLFHYGRFDMAVMHHAFGVMAAPIYCTKIASKIARTYTDRHGLKDLTRGVAERRDLQAAAIVRLGGRHSKRGATRLCRIGRVASARLAREA